MNYKGLFNAPEFQKQLDQKIISHINTEFGKVGAPLPLPKFRDDKLIYDDPRINKLVDRFRAGASIICELMDENEEKAAKAKEKNNA